jgi:hypothetical protein
VDGPSSLTRPVATHSTASASDLTLPERLQRELSTVSRQVPFSRTTLRCRGQDTEGGVGPRSTSALRWRPNVQSVLCIHTSIRARRLEVPIP